MEQFNLQKNNLFLLTEADNIKFKGEKLKTKVQKSRKKKKICYKGEKIMEEKMKEKYGKKSGRKKNVKENMKENKKNKERVRHLFL